MTTLPNDSAVTTDVLPTQAIQETTLETAPSSPPDWPDSTPTEPTCSRVGQEHVSGNGGRWFDDLPHFCSSAEPNFKWGEVGGMVFRSVLNRIYEETVHWSRNLFKIPSGKAGTAFVREISRMFRAFADSSALESVAMKVVMVMPALLLQKPHPRSKARDHVVHLERRLQLWLDGRLDELLKEGRTIQRQLLRNPPKQQEDTARVFAKLMMEGKVRAALRIVTGSCGGGLLPLDQIADPESDTLETVRDVLLKKHPPKQPLSVSCLLQPDFQPLEPHPVMFESIDGQLIRNTVLKMDGAAGPSGLDSAAWKRMCCSFKTASAELCESIASTARRLCSEHVDPTSISALVACRLIALDKCPGVRPIGVGETVRRIIGKSIATALASEIQQAAGPLQMCAGHLSGCEAAVHSMHNVFQSSISEGVILVDACNAFNSINRETALRNIQHLCPPIAKILINTYREDIQLFIDGATILSQEGTTQGDPLAMAMYAIAITPLIRSLEDEKIKQVWFADDATAGGSLLGLRRWWDHLVERGSAYGYYPNPAKTCLVLNEKKMEMAKEVFQGTGISITEEGKRHLGAATGTQAFVDKYVMQRVSEWVNTLERLSTFALTQPHVAYAAFTHGLVSKWNYLTRTVPNIGYLLQPLEEVIRRKFLPSLNGQNAFNDVTRDLLALPIRLGGLGIANPSSESSVQYATSKLITAPLTALIVEQAHSLPNTTNGEQVKIRKESAKNKKLRQAQAASELKDQLPDNMQKVMILSTEKGSSNWLSTLPIAEQGFVLHKGAFRDALCLRYGWHLPNMPIQCTCGKQFSVEHALSCPYGGFPTIRHNELRDITAELMSEVCHNVGTEPILQPITNECLVHRTANREDGARLDVAADSFWGNDRQRAFFDVRVFNPHAQSYQNTSLSQCYRKNEQEKKRAYDQRVREIEHGSFSPLIFSTTGGMGTIATVVYKRLAAMIADKCEKPYSQIIQLIRCRLNFSLLRSAIMCMRGSRSTRRHPVSSHGSGGSIDLACSVGRVPGCN